MGESSTYIHGSEPAEQERLSLMNSLMNDPALRELALKGGERILDVGCGLAQLTRAMAKAAGRRVLGVERDPRQRAKAVALAREAGEDTLVEIREGDVFNLPLAAGEWGSFDVAHARFVLEHVHEPLAVVRNMVRAVRPGGRIVLQDDDHDLLRLWPECPGFKDIWAAYVRTYDRLGNDAFIGRRLATLLQHAGAQPTRNTWIFFGSCSGNANLQPLIDNMMGILEGAKEAVLKEGFMDGVTFESCVSAIQHWRTRPDIGFWYSICWAEGVRPGKE